MAVNFDSINLLNPNEIESNLTKKKLELSFKFNIRRFVAQKLLAVKNYFIRFVSGSEELATQLFLTGASQTASGNFSQAIDYYKYAISLKPEEATYYKALFTLLDRAGREEEAMDCLEILVLLDGYWGLDTPQNLKILASYHFDQENHVQAQRYYDLYITTNQADYSEQKLYADVLVEHGQYDKAIELYTTLQKKNPDDYSFLAKFAHAYYSVGAWQNAVEIYDFLVNKLRASFEQKNFFINRLADSYRCLGQYGRAQKYMLILRKREQYFRN